MRDNLFRAKVKYPKSSTAFIGCDKNEGEWAVGDLHVRAAIPHIHNLWKKYPIDKDTVGQFIGLYDSKNRPIFKGDIIQSAIEGYNSKHEVIYVKEEAAFKARIIGSPIDEYCSLSKEWIERFQKVVIGNIHDNPELLTNK